MNCSRGGASSERSEMGGPKQRSGNTEREMGAGRRSREQGRKKAPERMEYSSCWMVG